MKTKKAFVHKNMNNRGFSLLELIVVIAVMAILVGVVVASSSMLDSSYVKEVERGIEDYVNMGKSKSMSVSAREWYVELTVYEGEYVTRLLRTEEREAGEATELRTVTVDEESYNDRVTVTFDDGVSVRAINASYPLCIYFDNAAGRVSRITVGGAEADMSSGIGTLQLSSGSYDIVLKLFYNTGKCERE